MGKSSAPKPDPNIGMASREQAELGKEWLEFSRQQYADLKPLIEEATQVQLEQMRDANMRSSDQWKQYESTYRPMENLSALNALGAQNMTDQQITELMQQKGLGQSEVDAVLASREASRIAETEAGGQARADVMQSADLQRQMQERQMASMGVNPNSGRFQGASTARNTQTALAAAGAENQARQQVRGQNQAAVADQANFGRGGTQVAAQQAGLGLNAGSTALQSGQTGGNIMGQGFQGAMAGNNAMISGLTGLHQIESQNVASQNAGVGQMWGAAFGLGAAALGNPSLMTSDKNKKTNKRKMKDGEGLKAVEKMPVEKWEYKEGVADGGEHIGAYAQDFKKATGIGDGKTIDVVSALGITMKAVQDVSKKVDKLAKKA